MTRALEEMHPERLYTLQELVEISGLSYDFWDVQCRTVRLAYLQPAGPRGTRFVPESAYRQWVDGCWGNPAGAEPTPVLGPAAADTEFTFPP